MHLLLLLAACSGAPDDDTKDGADDTGCAAPTDWFQDADDDGYGDATTSEAACVAPAGFVADATDCDDTDGAVNPAAVELCDPADVDEDCDGLTELDDPDAELVPFYFDEDEDGYGDPAVEQYACDAPVGFVAEGTDCDDGRSDIHPGATEFCDAADTDEDCDGLADDADDDVNTHGVDPMWADSDGDGYGDGAAYHVCDPTGLVAVDGDCDDEEPAVNPGVGETCGDGLDNNCDGDDNGCTLEGTFSAGDGAAVIYGEGGDRLATSVAGGGDLTGDGIPDLVTGSPEMGSYGEALVFAGPLSGTLGPADAAVVVSGASSDNRGIGQSVLAGYDWDADGDDDLLVGEPQSGTAEALGAAYVFYGPLGRSERTSSADRTYAGEQAYAQVGYVVAGGDMNGDSTDDLALVASVVSGRTGYHVLYVDHGPLGSGRGGLAASADATITSDNYVTSAAFGDVDGDGADELIVGAEYENDYDGAAWLVEGGSTGALDLQADAVASAPGGSRQYLGSSVALCDLDGDGARDAVVGGRFGSLDASGSGGVYVFAGPWSGTTALSSASATLSGAGSGDGFGTAVSCLGDVDGNGVDDLAVGAETADDGGSNSGAVYVYLTSPSGRLSARDATFTVAGEGVSDQLVFTGPIDDLTGDGHPEIWVASQFSNFPSSYAGMAAVFSAGGI